MIFLKLLSSHHLKECRILNYMEIYNYLTIFPLLDDEAISTFFFLFMNVALMSTFIQTIIEHINYLVLYKIWCLQGHWRILGYLSVHLKVQWVMLLILIISCFNIFLFSLDVRLLIATSVPSLFNFYPFLTPFFHAFNHL